MKISAKISVGSLSVCDVQRFSSTMKTNMTRADVAGVLIQSRSKVHGEVCAKWRSFDKLCRYTKVASNCKFAHGNEPQLLLEKKN